MSGGPPEELRDYLIAAAQQLLWLQGHLDIGKHVTYDRNDYRNYWYAAQLNLSAQLTANGVNGLEMSERERLQNARIHHTKWLEAKRPKK